MTITEFMSEYAVLIILVIAVLIMWGYSKYKQKQRSPKNNASQQQNVTADTIVADDLGSRFSDNPIQEKETSNQMDLVAHISEIVKRLDNEDAQLDENYNQDLKMIQYELQEIAAKKSQIQHYGRALANLFDKYRAREVQLQVLEANMKKLNVMPKS